jgi:uncharacterized glyoxalase superfamily protein PhnB
MTTTSTTRTTVWPTLIYRDAPAALRFLSEAFGFEESLVVPGDADGIVAHAEMRWPLGGGIMLGSVRSDSILGEKHVGAASVCVVSDEPDALFARATAAGAKVALGLEDTHYGARGFTVEDPEGNLWSFGTYQGA